MARITVVNDNPEFLELIGDILADERYETTLIDGDTEGALDRIRASDPEVLMIDLRLGSEGLHGWRIAQQIRADSSFDGTPILLCSADIHALHEVEQDLDDRYTVVTLTKPFAVDDFLALIDKLIDQAA